MQTIDLVTDAQTKPTPGMLAAMVGAEVGDEQRGTDPTVCRLESRVAELLDHEAAVFLPSGTMCNAIAIRLHVGPGGDEIIMDRAAHPAEFEAGGAAAMSGASLRLLDTPAGIFGAEQLRGAVREPSRYAPKSRLLVVEQATYRGRVWRLDELLAVIGAARDRGLRVHLDGARLLNAAAAAGEPPALFARDVDTAFIDFAKGLGCPVGAVLAGSATRIEEAWRYKQMWGGAMRQTGYLAAACLYALDNHVDRLEEDHANARVLADGLSGFAGVELDASTVETNIVIFKVDDAAAVCDDLRRAGVDLLLVDQRHLRAVTCLGVDRAVIDEALARARPILDR